MPETLLQYYQRELQHLRLSAVDFARRFDRIATRLELKDGESKDPHVERLLQGVAYLNARIRKKLDDDFPEIAQSLLGVLYPHYVRPIPSMSIVQFELSRSEGELTVGYGIDAGTRIETESDGKTGVRCQFRTAYPVTLWPVEVTRGAFLNRPFEAPQTPLTQEADACLRLDLRTFSPSVSFANLACDRLCFYLHPGSRDTDVYQLYELLLDNLLGIVVDSRDPSGGAAPPTVLPADVLRPVGFGREALQEPSGSDDGRASVDHALLPRDARSFRGYLLLTEFFAFPQKFLFVEITNLRRALSHCGREVSLYFLLDRTSADLARTLDKSTLILGATPMVNLFERKIDRLELTNEQSEILVDPDPRSRGGVAVFGIDRVEAVTPEGAATAFHPFYSFKHAAERDRQRTFWHATWRRHRTSDAAEQDEHPGDYWLSLVDLDLSPATLRGRTLRIQTTCYNGDRPAHLPQGRERPLLDLSEGRGPVAQIRCLRHPTRAIRLPEGYGAVWRLISQLSLNHLSLLGGPEAATALQEILLLHDATETAGSMIREGIRSVESRTVTRPLGRRIGGFGRGLAVNMMLDDKAFAHRGAYLFGSVLSHFLGQYVTINSFTELEIQTLQRRGREEPWKWPIRSGERPLA